MYTLDFIQDRLNHYRNRLREATCIKERSFLRGEVKRFKDLLKQVL